MVPQKQVMHGGTDYFTASNDHSVRSGNLYPWKKSQRTSENWEKEAALLRMLPKWENSEQVHKNRFLASKSNLPKNTPSLEIIFSTPGFQLQIGTCTCVLLAVGFWEQLKPRSIESQESGKKTYTQPKKTPRFTAIWKKTSDYITWEWQVGGTYWGGGKWEKLDYYQWFPTLVKFW